MDFIALVLLEILFLNECGCVTMQGVPQTCVSISSGVSLSLCSVGLGLCEGGNPILVGALSIQPVNTWSGLFCNHLSHKLES